MERGSKKERKKENKRRYLLLPLFLHLLNIIFGSVNGTLETILPLLLLCTCNKEKNGCCCNYCRICDSFATQWKAAFEVIIWRQNNRTTTNWLTNDHKLYYCTNSDTFMATFKTPKGTPIKRCTLCFTHTKQSYRCEGTEQLTNRLCVSVCNKGNTDGRTNQNQHDWMKRNKMK